MKNISIKRYENRRGRLFFYGLVVFLIILPQFVQAQVRIGFMNPQTVLDSLPEKEAIERQLNRFLDQRELEFEEKAVEFQNLLAQFQQDAPGLSDAELRRRQQELQVRDQELEEFQFRVQQELDQRQSELLGPVIDEMNRIIEQIAREKNLDFVMNEATAQGEMFILFISRQGRNNDLTDEVIARMLN